MIDKDANEHALAQNWETPISLHHHVPECFLQTFLACAPLSSFFFFLLKLMSSHLVTGIQFSLIHLSQSIQDSCRQYTQASSQA